LSAAAQLYEKSHLTRRIALSCGIKISPVSLSVEELIRMTEDRDKWRKYVHMVWPTLGSRKAKEQNIGSLD